MCEYTSKFQSVEIGELAEALAAVQSELEPAEKNAKNPHLKNKYADITAVYSAIRLILPKHGLAICQTFLPTENMAHVRTVLMHKSGQWIAGELKMPADRMGGVQGIGSAATYCRRYSLSALVGVVSEPDDDGESAMGRQKKQDNKSQDKQKIPAPNRSPFELDGVMFDIVSANSPEELEKLYHQFKEDAKAAGQHDALVNACKARKADLQDKTAQNAKPMTDPQRKALMAHYKGVSREERLADMSAWLERPIQSFSDLTFEDASKFLDILSKNEGRAA